MNVAVYETDEFHKDCTLIGEDVLREAGIETTTAKGEGPYINLAHWHSKIAIVPAIGGHGVEDIYLGEFSPQPGAGACHCQ